MLKHHRRSACRTLLCGLLITLPLGCAQQQAAEQPQPLSAAPSALQTPVQPGDAKNILLRMAGFLAEAQRFSVNIQSKYDVVQDSGQKIEFGETRQVLLSRPDRLRVDIEQSDGDRQVIFYDGKTMTLSHPARHVYAQSEIAGGIDAAVLHFVKDLKMRLPLAMLLVTRLPDELEQRTQSLAYVEKTLLGGIPAHHLAGTSATVDYQVWVADGNRPLPLRVVLTYKLEAGQPQFRAQFTDWNMQPLLQDSRFIFAKPEGSQKIAFLAQLPRTEAQSGGSRANGGQP